ncbi:hypothetical protein EX30DRAFT_361644 [Ascodesmis nigricans]|uniref:Structure-specific endonuclease subunit SLX4 n=1 Tax=Ascodesmis nigricans TaxID=341454 RepID=A0A4S2N2Z5_9PEZI|nr:hypothetical protein EX30DRAFT_361644 [Ascodesmis nigricans]
MAEIQDTPCTPSPPLRPLSPLSQLLSSATSLPSPNQLFASCFAKKNRKSASTTAPVTNSGLEKDIWDLPDDGEGEELVPRPGNAVNPKKPTARKKKASTTTGDGQNTAKPRRKATMTRKKKAAKAGDDDGGSCSKYFTKQSKPGKSSSSSDSKKKSETVGGEKIVTEPESPPRGVPPPPRLNWTPVKDTVKTIDLCSSSPELGESFSEQIGKLKCSRESSSTTFEFDKPEAFQMGSTTKRSLETIHLPNAHRAQAKPPRKPFTSPPKKKRKSSEGVPVTLLSPTSAQARIAEQEFVFGTSSQLEKEVLSINEEKSASVTTVVGGSLRMSRLRAATYEVKPSGMGLWDEGKEMSPDLLVMAEAPPLPFNEPEPELWLDTVDAKAKEAAPSSPKLTTMNQFLQASSASIATPEPTLSPTMEFTISSSSTNNPTKRPTSRQKSPSISSTNSAITTTVSKPPIHKTQSAAKPDTPSMPDYSTYTIAQLQEQISKYGMKKMSKSAMVKQLEIFWHALNQPTAQLRPHDPEATDDLHRPPSRSKRATSAAPRAKKSIPFDTTFITKAIRMAADMPNAGSSFYHHILMYDPIILEDLTEWLNKEGLVAAGAEAGAELKVQDVKEWCDENSVCALPRETQRGLERTRF